MSTVTFGKYKGKTAEEVLKVDPGYARWIVDTNRSAAEDSIMKSPNISAIADWLEKRLPSQNTICPMITFGKHKGLSVQEVMKKDPGYASWVIQKYKDPAEPADSFAKSKTMGTLASWFEKHGASSQKSALPPGIFLPCKENGTRFTIEEVSSIFSENDFNVEEAEFYDREGNRWENWKVKSLETKLRSQGYLDS